MSPVIIGGILREIIGAAREAIPDPDKQAEFEARAREIQGRLDESLVGSTTVPWVDAAVKLSFALVQLFRPLAFVGLVAFAAWRPDLISKLVEMARQADAAAWIALLGLFLPASSWPLLRTIEKVLRGRK